MYNHNINNVGNYAVKRIAAELCIIVRFCKLKSLLYYRALTSNLLHVLHPPRTIHRIDPERRFHVEDPSESRKVYVFKIITN